MKLTNCTSIVQYVKQEEVLFMMDFKICITVTILELWKSLCKKGEEFELTANSLELTLKPLKLAESSF